MHDVNPEVDPQLAAREPSSLEPGRLVEELAAARKRIDDLARAYQDGERDREEFKRRVQRERERLLDLDRAEIALALIEAIDELDRCLRVPEESKLYQGVKLIREKLMRKIEAAQIERLVLVGQPFDPRLAEAVDVELTGVPEEEGRITEELRAAYQLKGKVIRPGRVKVARYLTPGQA